MFHELDCEVEAFVEPERKRFGITTDWIDEHVRLMEIEAGEQVT